jgi:predicted MFS family arabinose efflux permease
LFIVAALVFAIQGANAIPVTAAVVLWGLAWGGAATLFQTASAKAAGEAADVAQSMIITVWNVAMACGGVVGGLLLANLGAGAFPWAVMALLILTGWVATSARRYGFASSRRG